MQRRVLAETMIKALKIDRQVLQPAVKQFTVSVVQTPILQSILLEPNLPEKKFGKCELVHSSGWKMCLSCARLKADADESQDKKTGKCELVHSVKAVDHVQIESP